MIYLLERLMKKQSFRWLIPLAGLCAFLWFLIRVIPKPSRAAYPCMRAAAPVASAFVVWLLGLFTSAVLLQRAKSLVRYSRYWLASLGIVGAAIVVGMTVFVTPPAVGQTAFIPSDAANHPIGTPQGIWPGHVVWTRDPAASKWDGSSGYWWESNNTDQSHVSQMLSRSLKSLTGQKTDGTAWKTLFRDYNKKHGKGDTGYKPNEKIAIKLNLNNCTSHGSGENASFTSPQMALGLLRQLIKQAGVKAEQITLYDASRYIPSTIYDPCKKEFPGVHFVDWSGGDGREQYKRDPKSQIHWSQKLTLEIGGGNPTYLPTCVTQANYLINLAKLQGHNLAGVSLCAKNHFGTICASRDGAPSTNPPKAAGLHPYVAVHYYLWQKPEWEFQERAMKTYNPIVDLMGNSDLGGKTLLYMVDGLYATPNQSCGVSTSCKWSSAPFNNSWTASLFIAQDDVALESVCLDLLRSEPTMTDVYGNVDNYLHEAALANHAPSGTRYMGQGGKPLSSLGVHEHWNSPTKRQYSGNLGKRGIQLVYLH